MQYIESRNSIYTTRIEIDQKYEIDCSQYWHLQIWYNGHIHISANSGEFKYVAVNMSVVEFADMLLRWVADWVRNPSDFNCDSEDDGQIFIWIRRVDDHWYLGTDVFDFQPHEVQILELQQVLWNACISLHTKLILDYDVKKLSDYHRKVILRFQSCKPYWERT